MLHFIKESAACPTGNGHRMVTKLNLLFSREIAVIVNYNHINKILSKNFVSPKLCPNFGLQNYKRFCKTNNILLVFMKLKIIKFISFYV